MISKKYFGFTLAEILITLAVVGVIAAITIPILMANYQKTQYVTGLKKAYTQFNQVLVQIAADKGCAGDLKCTGLFKSSGAGGNNTLGDGLVPYFKVIKNCTTAIWSTDKGPGCWQYVNTAYDGTGTEHNTYTWNNYKFITQDGVSYILASSGGDCGNDYSDGKIKALSQTCGSVHIDVNGPKKPNLWGRDIFIFYITNGTGPLLYPLNWRSSIGEPNSCYADNKTGSECSGRIMEEGWEMNY